MRPRRYASLFRACPKCRSPAGVACVGKKGARISVHKARLLGIGNAEVDRAQRQRGGALARERGFYGTDEWRAVRYQALRLHGGACQCCGVRASPGRPLHVDHIKPRSRFPDLALELTNLQVLCGDCNVGKGASDTIDWRTHGGAMQ